MPKMNNDMTDLIQGSSFKYEELSWNNKERVFEMVSWGTEKIKRFKIDWRKVVSNGNWMYSIPTSINFKELEKDLKYKLNDDDKKQFMIMFKSVYDYVCNSYCAEFTLKEAIEQAEDKAEELDFTYEEFLVDMELKDDDGIIDWAKETEENIFYELMSNEFTIIELGDDEYE